jgi:hypothetical protein
VVTWKLASILPVWGLVLVGSLLVALLAAAEYLIWLPIVLAAGVVVTFCVQLARREKDGFVTRLFYSVGGAFVIVALATAVLWMIA